MDPFGFCARLILGRLPGLGHPVGSGRTRACEIVPANELCSDPLEQPHARVAGATVSSIRLVHRARRTWPAEARGGERQ